MTVISAVTVNGIRGINTTVKLPGNRIIVTGNNGAGKSNLADAIRFGLRGGMLGLPGVDGQLWAEVSAGNNTCGSILTGGDGWVLERSLNRVGSTTKHTGSVNGGATLKTKNAVEGAMSAIGLDKIELIDMADFLAYSDAKKIAFLARFYDGDEFSLKSIKDQIDPDFHPEKFDGNQIELLDAIDAKIKKLKTTYTADKTSAANTIKNLIAQQNEMERPAGQISDIEAEISQLKLTEKQLRLDSTKAVENKAKYDTWKTDIDRVRSAITAKGDLKEVRHYQWQIDRCRDEQRKAQNTAMAQVMEFAQSVLQAMNGAGCDTCPVMLVPKKKIMECKKAATVDTAALDREIKDWQDLKTKAVELESLNKRLHQLEKDPRGKLLTEDNAELQQAAEGIQQRMEKLQADKEAMIGIKNLEAAVENTRLSQVKAEDGIEKIKDTEKIIKEIRAGVAAAIFAPAKKAVDKYLPHGESVFGFNENGALLMAWHIAGRERRTPRLGLSKGERAQFNACLALGMLDLMGSQSDSILIIEAAEVSRDNLDSFCQQLSVAPQNCQIIIETWSDSKTPAPQVNGWETIIMEYK